MTVSELSVLELAAERGELLPEREALQPVNIGNFASVTQAAANVADVYGSYNHVDQSISQSQDVDIDQNFAVDF